ncbi:MAG: transcription antitermination factor NusB [bacterium]
MGNRRKAREAALQILYPVDLSHLNAKEAMSLYWQNHPSQDEVIEFTRQLVEGVLRNQAEIDKLIELHSTHWKLGRMACVDRNILRMAVFELLFCRDIPKSVSLNEAIELGKKFGTEDSGAFINGVLDNIAKEVKP